MRKIDVVNKDTVIDIHAILTKDAQPASRFSLYQKDSAGSVTEIATAGSTGLFESLKYTQFEVGNNVYIDALDEQDNILYSVQTLVEVEDSSAEDVPKSFEFGNGMELTLSWPFNGNSLEIPICKLPVTTSIGEDGLVSVGINIDVVGKSNDFLTKLTDKGYLSDMLSDAKYNNFLLQSGYKDAIGKPKLKVNAAGYLKGSMLTGVYKGNIAISVSFGGSQESQTSLGLIPVVVEVTAKAKGTLSALAGFHCEDGLLKYTEGTGNLKLAISGELGLYGGVGLACLASVGVWGSAIPYMSLDHLLTDDFGLEELSLEGRAGVKALLFGQSFSVRLTPANNKTYIYKRDTSLRSASMNAAQPDNEIEIESEDIDRSYLSKTSGWNASANSDAASLLQSDVYPDVGMKIANSGDESIAVFMSDDSSRTDANRSTLVFTQYDSGENAWSSPQTIWDDGTADYSPSICADGSGGAYVTWLNSRNAIVDGASLSDKAQGLDVAYAHVTRDSVVDGYGFVSTGDTMIESSPRIGVDGWQPFVAWSSNSLDDPFGLSGDHAIYMARLVDDTWEVNPIGNASGVVTSLEVGVIDGPAVAWAQDADGQLDTIEDSSVALWKSNQVKVLSNESAYNPRFAIADGDDALVFLENGSLRYTTNGDDVSETSLTDVPLTTCEIVGDVIQDGTIAFTRTDESGTIYIFAATSVERGAERLH